MSRERPPLCVTTTAVVAESVQGDCVKPGLLAGTAAIKTAPSPERALEGIGDQVLGQPPVARAVGQETEQPARVRGVQLLELLLADHPCPGSARISESSAIRNRVARSYNTVAMTHLPDDSWPDDLQEVVDRLRDERPEPAPIELDRIKLAAMKRATRTAGTAPGRRGLMRSGLAGPVLSIGLVILGVVAIAGATTGSPTSMGRSKGNSSHVQYCKQESKSHHSLRSGSSAVQVEARVRGELRQQGQGQQLLEVQVEVEVEVRDRGKTRGTSRGTRSRSTGTETIAMTTSHRPHRSDR